MHPVASYGCVWEWGMACSENNVAIDFRDTGSRVAYIPSNVHQYPVIPIYIHQFKCENDASYSN